jgi:hypothetical protein
MQRSETEVITPSRHRPSFAAVVALPVAVAWLLACAATAGVLLEYADPARWRTWATDLLLWPALAAGIVLALALRVYWRGQEATNYSWRAEEAEPVEKGPAVWAQTARVGAVVTWKRLPDEPKHGAYRQLCHDLAYGKPFTEATAARHGFGRFDWQRIRDVFEQAEWAAWRDPANRRLGMKLTESGVMWVGMHADGVALPPQIRPR